MSTELETRHAQGRELKDELRAMYDRLTEIAGELERMGGDDPHDCRHDVMRSREYLFGAWRAALRIEGAGA